VQTNVRRDDGARVVEQFLLFLWCGYMIYYIVCSLVWQPVFSCGGIDVFPSWPSPPLSTLMLFWPLIVVAPWLFVVPLGCVWLLFTNQLEHMRGLLFMPQLVAKHYQRAPQWWTIALLLLGFCVYNMFFRYHVTHPYNGYVLAQDRLLGKQIAGSSLPCLGKKESKSP
jgi:hypothetical protein